MVGSGPAASWGWAGCLAGSGFSWGLAGWAGGRPVARARRRSFSLLAPRFWAAGQARTLPHAALRCRPKTAPSSHPARTTWPASTRPSILATARTLPHAALSSWPRAALSSWPSSWPTPRPTPRTQRTLPHAALASRGSRRRLACLLGPGGGGSVCALVPPASRACRLRPRRVCGLRRRGRPHPGPASGLSPGTSTSGGGRGGRV